MKKALKILIGIVLFGMIIIGVFVVFSFVSLPGNYKLYTVQSGSMEPAIMTGSLIFVKPMSHYQEGDVVTRNTNDPRTSITHRIINKGEENGNIYFETKGDANNSQDGEKVKKEDIVGKVLLSLPVIGFLVGYAKTGPGIILIIIVPALLIIYDEGKKIRLELRRIIERRINKEYYEQHPEKRP